jgi:hypothetical protein
MSARAVVSVFLRLSNWFIPAELELGFAHDAIPIFLSSRAYAQKVATVPSRSRPPAGCPTLARGVRGRGGGMESVPSCSNRRRRRGCVGNRGDGSLLRRTRRQIGFCFVLCNWSPRGVAWIHEVHAKSIQDKQPVVIIHDAADEIELPTKEEDVAFKDVYIVKGDQTNEVVLRRASVPTAHSVVILSDGREGKHADGKSVLTCITIRSISRGVHQPNISAECHSPNNRNHLRKAGADEIVLRGIATIASRAY